MAPFSITAVDILIVIVVLVSAGYAIYRGLIRETLSIFAWVLAVLVMLFVGPRFSGLLEGTIAPPLVREPLAYVIVFIALFIPLSYVGHKFRESIEKTPISPVDRILGFIFGLGRGVVVVGAVYLIFATLVPLREQPTWLTEARLYPLVERTGGILKSLVPLSDSATAAEVEATATARRQEPEASNAAPSYGADERQELDRLIESSGGR